MSARSPAPSARTTTTSECCPRRRSTAIDFPSADHWGLRLEPGPCVNPRNIHNKIPVPEGEKNPEPIVTTNDEMKTVVQPFKKGAFVLASQAGVPLVPVAIEGSGRCFPPEGFRIRPGVIRINTGAS